MSSCLTFTSLVSVSDVLDSPSTDVLSLSSPFMLATEPDGTKELGTNNGEACDTVVVVDVQEGDGWKSCLAWLSSCSFSIVFLSLS